MSFYGHLSNLGKRIYKMERANARPLQNIKSMTIVKFARGSGLGGMTQFVKQLLPAVKHHNPDMKIEIAVEKSVGIPLIMLKYTNGVERVVPGKGQTPDQILAAINRANADPPKSDNLTREEG